MLQIQIVNFNKKQVFQNSHSKTSFFNVKVGPFSGRPDLASTILLIPWFYLQFWSLFSFNFSNIFTLLQIPKYYLQVLKNLSKNQSILLLIILANKFHKNKFLKLFMLYVFVAENIWNFLHFFWDTSPITKISHFAIDHSVPKYRKNKIQRFLNRSVHCNSAISSTTFL